MSGIASLIKLLMLVLLLYIAMSIGGWIVAALALFLIMFALAVSGGSLLKAGVIFLLMAGLAFVAYQHYAPPSDEEIAAVPKSECLVAKYNLIPLFAIGDPLSTLSIEAANGGWTYWDKGDGSWNDLSWEEQKKVEIRRAPGLITLDNKGDQSENFTIFVCTTQKGGNFDNRFHLRGKENVRVHISVEFYDIAGQGIDAANPNFGIGFDFTGWDHREDSVVLRPTTITYPNQDDPDGHLAVRKFEDFFPDQNSYWVNWVVTLDPGESLEILDFKVNGK